MTDQPFDDADDPAAEPLEDEIILTDDTPTPRDSDPAEDNTEYNPAMSIGERMAAITECNIQIEALLRRVEEHGAAISVKATVMRREL